MASRFILPLADVGNGISPSDGAKLTFFITGTSTLKDTFSDEAATTPTNPVVSDGDGLFPEIWIEGSYKVRLTDKNDVQAWEEDPVLSTIATSDNDARYSAVFGSIASMLTLTTADGTAYVAVSGQSVYLTSYYTSIPFSEPQGGGGHFRVMTLAEYALTPDEIGASFTVGSFAFQIDSIAAIQAANDYVGSNGGGALHFPQIGSSNYFHIGTGITNTWGNMTYLGASPSSNQVRAMDSSNIDMYTCTPGGAGLDNISFTNMHFNGNKSNNTSGSGIVCSNIHAISHFEHTMTSQCADDGFNLTACTVVQMLNTYAISCDGRGYDIDSCSSIMMTDMVSEFHGISYMRIRNTADTDTIMTSVKGGHFEGATASPSSGFGIEISGGATKAVVVGLCDVEFRATSITANPIRINDARANVLCRNVTKAGWGAMLSNADTDHSVSNVGTLYYTYMPIAGITQLDDLTVVGAINNTQGSGDSLNLRRADFAALQMGEDDDNTWILQDNTSGLKGFDRRSAVTVQRFEFDSPVTATHTSFLLYDVDSDTVQRVKVGANGSGSIASHRMLQVPDS